MKPNEAPARRERNAAETKKRLLDSAEAEFASKGFAGARLREVAQVAGVQQALIHHYFVDKEGLYRAVLDRAVEQATAGSWAILKSATSLESLVESFVGMLIEFYTAHANLLSMLRMEALSGESVVLELIQQKSRPVFDAAELLLLAFQRQGKLRPDVQPSEAIALVLSMTLFPMLEAPLLAALWPAFHAGQAQLEQRKHAIAAVALRGLAPPAALAPAPPLPSGRGG